MLVKKPWGDFKLITENQQTTIKILNINAGHRLSLQYHNKREEKWMIISGKAKATIEAIEHILNPGNEITIPVTRKHRLGHIKHNCGRNFNGEFDEDDIVRLHDDYNR